MQRPERVQGSGRLQDLRQRLQRQNSCKGKGAAPLREVNQPALQRQVEISATIVHNSLQSDLCQESVLTVPGEPTRGDREQ
jgi:hypothetical protein